jgi:hypothetical protein
MKGTPEGKPLPQPEQSPEEIIAEIQAYFADANFGSVKFLALEDYIKHSTVSSFLEFSRRWVGEVHANTSGEYTQQEIILAESSLRIDEMKFVLTEQSIEQHHSTLPDHYHMFHEISRMSSNLSVSAKRASVEDIGLQALREIRDALYQGNTEQTAPPDTSS